MRRFVEGSTSFQIQKSKEKKKGINSARDQRSELEAACEVHDAMGIIPLLYLSQPRHVFPVDLLQWRPEQRIIRVTGGMLQILAILNSRLGQLGAQCAHVVVHIPIERLVGPSEEEARRQDGMRTIGWERGWSSVCEDVIFKRVGAENDYGVLIVLADSVAPGL